MVAVGRPSGQALETPGGVPPRQHAGPLARVNILGVGISAINMSLALAEIERWLGAREQHYVCVSTVHGVMECQRDPVLRSVFNGSGMTTPDGMPLVWLSRLLGHRHVDRVYGPDLLLALCEWSASKGYRHYFYGGAPGVAPLLARRLSRRFPGLAVAGASSPPFRSLTPEEDQEAVAAINEAAPDIVWVGMSTPKQDRWMADHAGRVSAPVLVGIGAAFDFHAGVKRQAPRWVQRSGFEWLYRLLQEPRRLWFRYLVYNPLFVVLVALQLLGLRGYPLERPS